MGNILKFKNIKIILIYTLFFSSFFAWSQKKGGEFDEKIDEIIDEITYEWDIEAHELSTYPGFTLLCKNKKYRRRILNLLDQIHHYDTVLYSTLVEISKTNTKNREVINTLKDIQKFEIEYNTQSFIQFMSDECGAMKIIEKRAKKTANDVGFYSYSGQVYVLETELFKYVTQVTKRVDKIRLHIHRLSDYYD